MKWHDYMDYITDFWIVFMFFVSSQLKEKIQNSRKKLWVLANLQKNIEGAREISQINRGIIRRKGKYMAKNAISQVNPEAKVKL